MPRHIFESRAPSPRHVDFVARLARELKDSGGLQPVILEQRVRETKSRHVQVIWD